MFTFSADLLLFTVCDYVMFTFCLLFMFTFSICFLMFNFSCLLFCLLLSNLFLCTFLFPNSVYVSGPYLLAPVSTERYSYPNGQWSTGFPAVSSRFALMPPPGSGRVAPSGLPGSPPQPVVSRVPLPGRWSPGFSPVYFFIITCLFVYVYLFIHFLFTVFCLLFSV